jgi:hypothetical protein
MRAVGLVQARRVALLGQVAQEMATVRP